jgi:hypothetical protein
MNTGRSSSSAAASVTGTFMKKSRVSAYSFFHHSTPAGGTDFA